MKKGGKTEQVHKYRYLGSMLRDYDKDSHGEESL